MRKFNRHLLLGVCGLAVCASVGAVQNGFIPQEGGVIHPYSSTAVPVNVWKLVGRAQASAFQIHREWILASWHQNENNAMVGAYFENHLGGSVITNCFQVEKSPGVLQDIALCRLGNPGGIAAYGEYPPLVAPPLGQNGDVTPDPKLGAFFVYGFGGFVGLSQGRAAIVDFSGIPLDFEPALATSPLVFPYKITGDSGGALYWLSPNSDQPANIGVMTGAGSLGQGYGIFTEHSLNFIVSTVARYSSTLPAVRPLQQHYTGSLRNPPRQMNLVATKINLVDVFRTGRLSWAKLPGNDNVTGYQVTWSVGGALVGPIHVPVVDGVSQYQTPVLVPNKEYVICVRPVDEFGPSAKGDLAWTGELKLPNCNRFNTNVPAPVSGLSVAPVSTLNTSLVNVSAVWGEGASTGADMSLTKYQVRRSVTSSTGVKRVTLVETTQRQHTIAAPRGSQVCIAVAARSMVGVTGAYEERCARLN